MSLKRLNTAFKLTLRELSRRRGMITIMALIPVVSFSLVYLALPDMAVSVDAIEKGVHVRMELSQVEMFGGVMALIYVALMAGIVGYYVMSSAVKTDRRLILAGYLPLELVAARCLALLVLALGIVAAQMAVMLFFFVPQQFFPYLLSLFWAAMIYGFFGALFATLIKNELGGILAVVFFADIEVGYFQLPGYSNFVNEWWTQFLPGHFPVQLAIDAGFTAAPDMLARSFWALAQAAVVAAVMLATYNRVTQVHPFLPEARRRFPWWAVGLAAAALAVIGGVAGYQFWSSQPQTVKAEGRVSAESAPLVAPVSGRVRLLTVAEGDAVQQGRGVAWIASALDGSLLAVSGPISGQVTALNVKEGENVVAGQALATIHRVNALEAVLEVDENSVQQVAVGQRVELTFPSLGVVAASRVTSIAATPLPPDPTLSEKTRNIRRYAVKCALEQPDSRLRVGMAAIGRIYTEEGE